MRPDFVIDVYWDFGNSSNLGKEIISKAKAANHSNYFIIGPYSNEHNDFIEKQLPASFVPAFDELKNLGITLYYGKIHNAKAILVDYSRFSKMESKVKEDLWSWFQVDSFHSSKDFNEKAVFGYSAGMAIEKLMPSLNYGKGILNCHGWEAASCILYAKARKLSLASIFTINSTALGAKLRELGIYSIDFDADKESYKHNYESKHQLEKAAASNSSLVTSVSEHSALEGKRIWGITPQLIIPASINNNEYSNLEESAVKSNLAISKLKEFVSYYFFPYYTFNLSDTLFFFVSGEMDPGLENSIKALSSLNKKLKGSGKTIATFFFMPALSNGIKSSLKENRDQLYLIKSMIDENESEIKGNLLASIMDGSKEKLSGLISSAKKIPFRKKGSPLLTTHDLQYEEENNLLKLFKKYKLLNSKNDNVKVILYPNPSKNDGLLNLDIKDLIPGFNLGIFPSASNNFSYMPLDTMALSVPVITTDIHFRRLSNRPGHSIIPANDSEEFSEALEKELYGYAKLSIKERVNLKLEAKNSALSYDWSQISKMYDKAYLLAFENKG